MNRPTGPLAPPPRLAAAIAALDPTPRLLLELWLRGFHLADLAAESGVPEDAVAETLRTAVEHTRHRLSG